MFTIQVDKLELRDIYESLQARAAECRTAAHLSKAQPLVAAAIREHAERMDSLATRLEAMEV